VLLSLSENPLVLSLDISFIDSLLSRFINQFSAIPTLVGILSLLAAAVAMANTVSLATLERRRTIGVLKAVGLKGQRILLIMLLENTLIGLLGGLIGIGLSALGVALMTAIGQGAAIPIPREATGVAIALLVAAVVIAWTATFLSARPAVSEPVNSVLRYE
jgi:putative ABC transport system permease protein